MACSDSYPLDTSAWCKWLHSEPSQLPLGMAENESLSFLLAPAIASVHCKRTPGDIKSMRWSSSGSLKHMTRPICWHSKCRRPSLSMMTKHAKIWLSNDYCIRQHCPRSPILSSSTRFRLEHCAGNPAMFFFGLPWNFYDDFEPWPVVKSQVSVGRK